MFDLSPRLHRSLLVASFLLAMAGCSSLQGARATMDKVATIAEPYKIDIVQGNVVTREQLAALKIGMPRAQVRDILGTPLLVSVFHDQRWDFVFTFKRQGSAPQSRKVTIVFNGDTVEKIDADELPSETEFVATLKSQTKIDKLPPLQASEDSLKKYPPPAPVEPAAQAPAINPASYPPLESGAK